MNANQLIETSRSHNSIEHVAVESAAALEVEVSVNDDLCENWLGRDWPSSTSPAEAMRIATACQASRDAGDSRDYTAILADVVG